MEAQGWTSKEGHEEQWLLWLEGFHHQCCCCQSNRQLEGQEKKAIEEAAAALDLLEDLSELP